MKVPFHIKGYSTCAFNHFSLFKTMYKLNKFDLT